METNENIWWYRFKRFGMLIPFTITIILLIIAKSGEIVKQDVLISAYVFFGIFVVL